MREPATPFRFVCKEGTPEDFQIAININKRYISGTRVLFRTVRMITVCRGE